jgi:hypothetical protein
MTDGSAGRKDAVASDVRAERPWYARPRVVLTAVAGLVVLSALFARDIEVGRSGDPRLSTYHTGPQGASLFYELADRLGWSLEQRLEAAVPPGPEKIHALLSVPISLRITEVRELLERVREGAALLLVLEPGGDAVGDSLHVRVDDRDFYGRTVQAEPGACPDSTRAFFPLWPDNRAHLYALAFTAPRPPGEAPVFVMLGGRPEGGVEVPEGIVFPRPPVVNDTQRDSTRRPPSGPVPAVIGFQLGRGRVVVASDPDFLRNDVLRECAYGLDVRAVRALEYLRAGGDRPRSTIVFDEYHQGYGRQPGTTRAIAGYLMGTRSGHLLFQMLGAGLLLLFALAPRALTPRHPERIERRSPLEHVDALARAYGQLGATRTAAAHLVRGVRRRLERGAVRARTVRTDEAFLRRVAETAPALSGDVAIVRRALGERVSPKELELAGAALERIETSLKRT